MDNRRYVVYRHIFTNGKSYIGIVSKSCIARCAKGGRKTSAGYVWRYDNDNI